jgi:catechol 2,3-dioxygenase-like lactoylglutathione lyase family enzyme
LRLGAIAQVSLEIRDVARAEAFYRDVLGLPHVFRFGDLASFDAAGVCVYLQRTPQVETSWRRMRNWPAGAPRSPGHRK